MIDVNEVLELRGHRVVVSYGTCQVIAGKLLNLDGSITFVGTTKSDIPHPINTDRITNVYHAKLECRECGNVR